MRLAPIEVRAAPFVLSTTAAPFAVSQLRPSDEARAASPPLTLDRLTLTIPGLWINNRENYSTGERILVRGLGWRSAFGVRGVQVLLDGLPLTMADGQSMLNVVDPAFVREVELIRGPASTFWGNSSGGVLAFSTRPPASGALRLFARQTVGAYGLAKTDVAVTPNLGRHQLHAYGSYFDTNGYRDHSATTIWRAGLTSTFDLGDARRLRVIGALADVPYTESPGGISAEAVAENPTQTRSITVARNAGKELTQGQAGVTYEDRLGRARVQATVYGTFRTLDNAIIPRLIDLDRRAGGTRLTLEKDEGALRWGLGAELKGQRDDRQERAFDDDDQPTGPVLTDQTETVDNQAVFGRAAWQRGPVVASAGLRFDRLMFEADDRLDAGSGTRTFQAWSPSLGLLLRLPTGQLFANFGTALDAPTTTELGNRPDGSSGFNPALNPERTFSAEIGGRGAWAAQHLFIDAAVFALRVSDLLLPFEVNDVTFYRNEGSTRHLGAEVALDWSPPGTVSAASAYTLVDARFTGEGALEDNRVPGIPRHVVNGEARWAPGPLWLALSVEAASSYPVDSGNSARNDGYVVAHARALYTGLSVGAGQIQPFVELTNVFDTRYNGSVVINAFGGRYYEPAAGRHLRAGLTVEWN